MAIVNSQDINQFKNLHRSFALILLVVASSPLGRNPGTTKLIRKLKIPAKRNANRRTS